MSDLRESGQLEQDADVVMLLDKDDSDPKDPSPDRLLYIDKNKNGTLGMVRLAFDGDTQVFTQRVSRPEPRQGYGVPKPEPKKDPFQAMEDGEAIDIPEEFL